jgi:hypothetical protein
MAGHACGRQQPDESEQMIAVQVRDKNARDLTQFQITAQQLVLCAFAAIEEPDLASLRQAQSDARNISRACRHTGAGSKKSYLQRLSCSPRL